MKALLVAGLWLPSLETCRAMEWVRVDPQGGGFLLHPSSRPFIPIGFNYDHDERFRLLEDYWESEWPKVEEDFREMKALGANTVRLHLQLGRIMSTPDKADQKALDRLEHLLIMAEGLGLHLDLTGLGTYREEDIPGWFDHLPERERWEAQAVFWEAVAAVGSRSPAVFCYNLMNEPAVSAEAREPGAWLAPPFDDGYHYVQFLAVDPAGRSQDEIGRRWVRKMIRAIRKHDPDHMVTVGLFDWGLKPESVVKELDFLSVHIYPRSPDLQGAADVLKRYSIGKPVLIEETGALHCSVDELGEFLRASRDTTAGWLGFYWGKTPEELKRSTAPADALMLGWLDFFRRESREWTGGRVRSEDGPPRREGR